MWRDGAGALRAGPGACPHMGERTALPGRRGSDPVPLARARAALASGVGLATDPAYDDGVLVWVNLPTLGEVTTSAPVVRHGRPGQVGDRCGGLARRVRCSQDIVFNG